MVTTAPNAMQIHRKRKLSRKLFVGAILAALMVITVQSGLIHPATLIDRIPAEYVPDAVQRYLPNSTPKRAILPNAYLYQQQRPLSCEYAATSIASQMGGWNISEYDFDEVVPLTENPHYGYRGNIWGEWGNTTDYGLYPEPLHRALTSWGVPNQVIYAHGDADVLRHELNQGRAVVVWLAMRGPINSFDVVGNDGVSYQLTQYMHVMTAYGFDESGVYLTDPGTAVWRHYDWQSFMEMWNVMDGMALSVYPKSATSGESSFTQPPTALWIRARS